MHNSASEQTAEERTFLQEIIEIEERALLQMGALQGRIKKFKPSSETSKIWLIKEDEKSEKASILTIKEELHDDIFHLMKQLVPIVKEILCLPPWYPLHAENVTEEDILRLSNQSSMHITGVTWSYHQETEIKGVVISGFVGLDTANSPFNFNTPHLPFEPYNPDNTDTPLFPIKGQEIIAKIELEIWRIINGKRAQGDLFAGISHEAKQSRDYLRGEIAAGNMSIHAGGTTLDATGIH